MLVISWLLLVLVFAYGRSLHFEKFLLLNYHHQCVIYGISIYGLITTQVGIVTMHGNNFNKSTATSLTSIFLVTRKLLDIPQLNDTTDISHPPVTSSATFLRNDSVIDPASEFGVGISRSMTDTITKDAISVNLNTFEIGTANLLQHTLSGHVVKHKRCIHDLWAKAAENSTELISQTTLNSTKNWQKLNSLSSKSHNSSFVPILAKSMSTDIPEEPHQQTQLYPNNKKIRRVLSRSKRFLTFPEGASFSVAVCITVGIIGNPRFNYMAYGLNWGVAYDLPNTSWVINHLHGFSRHPVPATILRRRTQRALYNEIEALVDNMGYNGRDCVLRALCESRQYFRKNKLSMVGEMLRVIFSLPRQRLFTRELHENSGIELYDHAYRHTRDIDCNEEYDCSFSLLELAFGKYSTPPPGYYQ